MQESYSNGTPWIRISTSLLFLHLSSSNESLTTIMSFDEFDLMSVCLASYTLFDDWSFRVHDFSGTFE